MTKSATLANDGTAAPQREVRPFLYLEPARLPLKDARVDVAAIGWLEQAAAPWIPQLVRSLVDFTIARQNRRALERGPVQPIQLSVLNRRRRAARSWLNAIVAGKTDAATRHAVATQWLPLLTATGPDLRASARFSRAIVEFVRGAITACVFDEPDDCLLPHARALHVLESALAAHLAAVHQAARAAAK
jgi:hypothetical protein